MRAWLPLTLAVTACGPQDLPRLSGPIGDDGVAELRHTVDVRFGHGQATLTVERTFRNEGEALVQLERAVSLPQGGAVTRFRQRIREQWSLAELLDVGEALERFDA